MKTSHHCPETLTPFSDEEEEGKFINIHDGTDPKYLPWAAGQPDGKRGQNALVFDSIPFYKDTSKISAYCFSCTLKTSLFLELRNICKGSFLGKTN